MDAIFSRRSIRKYSDRQVPEELIRKVLAAGMNAPSAGNEQPWQFIVIKDKNMLKQAAECSPYARAAAEAPAAILVCGDLSQEKYPGYWVQDCSAAVENMLIEIHSLGLGSVWLGVHPMPEREEYLRRLFSLPGKIIPFALLPVGYPAQQLPAVDRFNPDRVHYEKW
jgi:nitroreductase